MEATLSLWVYQSMYMKTNPVEALQIINYSLLPYFIEIRSLVKEVKIQKNKKKLKK